MQQRFPSRVDGWFVATMLGVVAATAAAWTGVAAQSGLGRDSAVAALACAGALALPLWIWRATYYELQGNELLVRSGPLRWRVPLAQVRAVAPSRSLLSGPALSLKRLRIDYGRGKSLLVSPRDAGGFLRALRQRCPQAAMTGF